MEIYAIKKNKHYSSGDRFQFATIAYSLAILSILLSFFVVWWAFLPGLFISIFLWSIAKEDSKSESKRVMFSRDCIYKLDRNYDQINKLFGISEGYHHWNSARFGWRCIDAETIEILAYCYIDGERIVKPIMKCKPDSWFFCNLQNKEDKYIFKTLDIKNNGYIVYVNKANKKSFKNIFSVFIYKLFPYFGGEIVAPQNMKIFMVNLKTK